MDFGAPARTTLRRPLVVALGTSSGFHAALAPAHDDTPEAAALFAASALLLVAIAIAVERGGGILILATAAAVLAGLIAAYTASRTGVIWPLDHREPVDALGATTKLFEAIGLALALRLMQIQRGAAKVPPGETKGVHA